MIKINNLVIIGIISLFWCCQKNGKIDSPENKHLKNVVPDYHQKHFNGIRSKIDRIEILLYEINDSTLADTTKLVKSYSKQSVSEIQQFYLLFEKVKNGGYLCCPKTHYIIDFYKMNKRLKRYNVDTIILKNKVLIFDTSYQTSYTIPLNDWNNYSKKSRTPANSNRGKIR